MRVALIAAGVVVALVMAGASPAAAAPQSSAAESRRPAPTAAEVQQIRDAIAEYRKGWMGFDAETRSAALSFGAPTPDALERMFEQFLRDLEAGRDVAMPELPANLPGNLGNTLKKLPSSKAPAAPAKPGEEAPDFAKGAPKEALETLKDAKVDLDSIRDKHAETASCPPEARSGLAALQTKLQAYRKALADMEAARRDVQLANGAGDTLELATLFGGAANAVKSTADAAMDLFGAAGNLLPETPALKPLKSGIEVVGSIYSMLNGGLSTLTAENTLSGTASATGAAVGWARTGSVLQPSQTVGGRSGMNVALAAGDLVAKSLDTAVLNSESSREGETSRNVETVGNVLQMAGTVKGALGELPGAADSIGKVGAVFTVAGTVTSTSAKYDRELGKAFDTIVAGKDERREYNALNESTLRQVDAKRVEFMGKIAELEAEIGRSGCK